MKSDEEQVEKLNLADPDVWFHFGTELTDLEVSGE